MRGDVTGVGHVSNILITIGAVLMAAGLIGLVRTIARGAGRG